MHGLVWDKYVNFPPIYEIFLSLKFHFCSLPVIYIYWSMHPNFLKQITSIFLLRYGNSLFRINKHNIEEIFKSSQILGFKCIE